MLGIAKHLAQYTDPAALQKKINWEEVRVMKCSINTQKLMKQQMLEFMYHMYIVTLNGRKIKFELL